VIDFLQYCVNGLVMGLIYGLIGIGLTVIYGMMRIVNIAHGEFLMMGAYLFFTFVVILQVGFLAGLVLGLAVALAAALVVYYLYLRSFVARPIVTTTLATLGLAFFLRNLVLIVWGPQPHAVPSPFGAGAISVGGVSLPYTSAFALGVTAAVMVLGHAFLTYARTGKAMRATFQNREVAELVGVNTDLVHGLTFALGAGLAALGGILLAPVFSISPDMGTLAGMKAWTVTILGGMGSLPGALVAGIVIGLAESLASGYVSSGYKEGIAFLVVVAVLLHRPHGFLGARGRE
jgi:branched-chain amino acid transport system permease protein